MTHKTVIRTVLLVVCLFCLSSTYGQYFTPAKFLPMTIGPDEGTDSLEVIDDDFIDEDPEIPVRDRFAVEPFKSQLFMPIVYTHFRDFHDYDPFKPELSGDPWMEWVERAIARSNKEAMLIQRSALARPEIVRYNLATLPEPPKDYIAAVDPSKHTIEIREVTAIPTTDLSVDIKKKHWLRTFNASVQFSQAYISPNWYQGGNNNLNMQVNVFYNVKLNPAYHPNLLFESTMQYKLGMNSAPDDSLRNYSISEDLLQLNATFGIKAAKRWYYSLNAQFKTQLLNSYVSNTRNLSAAFLSPAEFNAGIGMTYNFVNPKKTVSFDASISPISYNMKICTQPDDRIAHSTYDIAKDKNFKMHFGSTAECKFTWQITKNIQYRSRLFVFSDYSYIQGDWENTLAMDINRYLSTQIYAHLRYDSTTPTCDDPSWHKLQVKEILSFGVTYKFSSI